VAEWGLGTTAAGIPHILEHSVLCGSRKYPIKEPFVELMKGSLNTFLNAFTYPDRTCYPVASCNLQDFYNLVDVYLDAVLHPTCVNDKQVFEQEGWHYELEDPADDITFKVRACSLARRSIIRHRRLSPQAPSQSGSRQRLPKIT
jgi:Zn-dependent M16 (insulinase) family peptidase